MGSVWPFKRKSPETQDAAGKVLGRYYVDWVEPIKDLKRRGDLPEAERILLACVDGVEREAAVTGSGVAPWYYEQLAIIYRKQDRLADEVMILQRYVRQKHAPGSKPDELADRLVKASELWAKQQGTATRAGR